MKKRRTPGKPSVDRKIGNIVQDHIGRDTAITMFEELSKVGGNSFQTTMRRIKRIIQEVKV